MADTKKIEFLDYIVLIVTWKKVLLSVFLVSLVLSYLFVRFCVAKQYTATATIIPTGEANGLSGLTSLIKDFSVALPSGLSGMSKESEMDIYTTILFSRTSIERLIRKFDLQKLYKIKSREEAIKAIKKAVRTNVTMENAYVISASSNTPQRACDIANDLVAYLNDKVIELHIAKAKDNRLFLEQRYNEIESNAKNAEDSLRAYQEEAGVFEADAQTRATLESLSKLESDLAVKQIEYSVVNKIYGENSQIASNAKISLQEYQNLFDRLINGQDKTKIIMGISSLPKKTMRFYRYFRDVKIYNQMLEFIVPLFEQSKFDEQKTVPIIQIIDPAVPPEKKAYPPRVLMALITACTVVFITIFYLIMKEILSSTGNPKMSFIKKELFNFKNK
jgi:tyrosine-protein kinase Etk/Wzc